MDSNDFIIIKKIDSIINENDILVDVGAHLGTYTKFFVEKLNKTGKIYSIELHPNTFEFLKNNFHECKNVILMNNAVCDTDRKITFYSGKDSFTNNIIGHDMNYSPNNVAGEIQGITLDTLLQKEQSVKLVKIDVEGSELLVLNGMKDTLKKLDYLLIECHLDEHWDNIKPILLGNFVCENAVTGELITDYSTRQYQCLCKKK